MLLEIQIASTLSMPIKLTRQCIRQFTSCPFRDVAALHFTAKRSAYKLRLIAAFVWPLLSIRTMKYLPTAASIFFNSIEWRVNAADEVGKFVG